MVRSGIRRKVVRRREINPISAAVNKKNREEVRKKSYLSSPETKIFLPNIKSRQPTIKLLPYQFDSADLKVVIGVSFYCHPELTEAFLRSIKQSTDKYKLFITEDGSSEQKANLQIINNFSLHTRLYSEGPNLGFLKAQNRMMEDAFELEKADVYISVNSDILFTDKQWLSKMLKYMYDNNMGLASPALIEGGGRHEMGLKSTYPHELKNREYVTGACLFISQKVYKEIGAFDEIFGLGYCEDPDYSYKAHSLGHNIGVNKNVILPHIENATFGTLDARENSIRSATLLMKRWGTSSLPKIVLTTPWNLRLGEAAGTNGVYRLLQYLSYRAKVYFYPTNPSIVFRDTNAPNLPLEDFHITKSPLVSANKIGQIKPDLVFGSWWWDSVEIIKEANKHQIKNCLWTVDLHYAREASMEVPDWEQHKLAELDLYNQTSALTVISETDKEMLPLGLQKKTFFIPHRTVPPFFLSNRPSNHTIGFLSFWGHPPNEKSLAWFTKEVWPLVRNTIPDATLLLFGHDEVGKTFPYTQFPGVEYAGHIPTLEELFANVDCTIAPLFYGAGVNAKVVDSLTYNRPVVMTERVGKTINLSELDTVSDNPIDQAKAVIRLLTDQDFYNQQLIIQKTALDTSYGYKAFSGGIQSLFSFLGIKLGGV